MHQLYCQNALWPECVHAERASHNCAQKANSDWPEDGFQQIGCVENQRIVRNLINLKHNTPIDMNVQIMVAAMVQRQRPADCRNLNQSRHHRQPLSSPRCSQQHKGFN